MPDLVAPATVAHSSAVASPAVKILSPTDCFKTLRKWNDPGSAEAYEPNVKGFEAQLVAWPFSKYFSIFDPNIDLSSPRTKSIDASSPAFSSSRANSPPESK